MHYLCGIFFSGFQLQNISQTYQFIYITQQELHHIKKTEHNGDIVLIQN